MYECQEAGRLCVAHRAPIEQARKWFRQVIFANYARTERDLIYERTKLVMLDDDQARVLDEEPMHVIEVAYCAGRYFASMVTAYLDLTFGASSE